MASLHWEKALFYSSNQQGLLCTLCPHACLLQNEEKGKCHIRRVQHNQMQTAAFNSAVKHYGPIERKPLYHFFPGSEVLTLAGPGCNFRCLYCQNYRLSQWDLSHTQQVTTNKIRPKDIIAELIAKTDDNKKCIIGLSYSEPGISAELTLALAEEIRDQNIAIVWKSNGFLTRQAVQTLAPCLSAINIDLKTIDDKAHRSLTGASVTPVLEAINAFREAGVWVEISTPIIPRFNSKPEQLDAIAGFIHSLDASTPWHLGRFIPEYKLDKLPPTSMEEMSQAFQIGKDNGLNYVYMERSDQTHSQTTNCPSCNKKLILRKLWILEQNNLENGKCPNCHTSIAGRWN